jgi:hypothetical protein
MNEDAEFGYKARQILNQGVDDLDQRVVGRLQDLRQTALGCQKVQVAGLRLAGSGRDLDFFLFADARNLVAIVALLVGAAGTYYWNAFELAQEYEEIDSALLADELPPSAYLDRGFQAWLERASDSSSQ